MDQFDPWQVVPRQVFTPYSSLLNSAAFVVVVSRVDCLGVTGVVTCPTGSLVRCMGIPLSFPPFLHRETTFVIYFVNF